MSFTAEIVETLLTRIDADPSLINLYPQVCAFLKDWILDGTDELASVHVRSKLIVEKVDTERFIVFVDDTGILGWLIGKDAKKEEWEKQFPGASEKVWVIPYGHPVLRPISDFKPIMGQMAVHLKQHPWLSRLKITPPIPLTEAVSLEITQAPPTQEMLFEPDPETESALLIAAQEEILAKEAGIKKPRVKLHNVKKRDTVKKPKAPKKPKVKVDRSLATVFRGHLANLNIEALKKPWMATKDIRLVDTAESLQAWVDGVLADPSRWRKDVLGDIVPIIAVDAETIGLDNRIIVDVLDNGSIVYEVKAEVAGLCLASHADEGIYVPIHHVQGLCISREDVCRILQPLFDRAHLVFYNAKFDREILRLCLGISCRPFPHFEDVQILQYDNDPKADLDEQKKKKQYDAGGLKHLSKTILGMEQIELEELVKVSATYTNSTLCECKHLLDAHEGHCKDCKCERFKGKETMRLQYAPFNWLPTDIAVWYAAPDATCTWALWEKTIFPARNRKVIHKIDHQLADSITWIERQRLLIDVERHAQTVKWHQGRLRFLENGLRELASKDGWVEKRDDDGNVIEQSIFNVNSPTQMGHFLFDIRGMKVIKRSEKTGVPSVDVTVMEDLSKIYPDDPFLTEYSNYKDYVSLHPENLRYDPADHSARVYFRQNVVAGGRLSASGGEFDLDGGFELNPQGIKKPEGNWSVYGRILHPDFIPHEEIELHEESELHKSCFRSGKKAKGIINNHIANYLGYSICLVPTCTTCDNKFGILIEDGHLDSNEVLNLRCLFVAPDGWTFFSADYNNVEMRVAANSSGEPEFIKEFLEGEGDFHSLTASKVFPEFNDPQTSKEVRKTLRALAKIINFALLYGGTAYTIFENMKKQDPTITFARCEEMVDNYWNGVPVFKEFCNRKQKEAREGPLPSNEPVWDTEHVYHHGDIVQYDPSGRYDHDKDHAVYSCINTNLSGVKGGDEPKNGSDNWIKYMRCATTLGRIVSFVSAMEAQGIRYPVREELNNLSKYYEYKNMADEAKAVDDNSTEKEYQALAQALWSNSDTGVKNAIDWKKFFGKIQRVAVNTPLQGLAGDFMRMSLNKICDFATVKEPFVQSVFRLHATIHDEIDFIVKNEYVPYVLPRITRLMKLRKLHSVMNWTVPIECDIEYGHSWDVQYHVTGDKDHTPVAWTKIKGMEKYVPADMLSNMKPLLAAIESADANRVEKAKAWFASNVNPHAANAVELIFKATDHAARVNAMIVTFQLHEYWTVDATPDDNDKELETFEAWEKRMELSEANRDPKYPFFGFLGAIPLNANIRRPILTTFETNPLGPLTEAMIQQVMSEDQTLTPMPQEPPESQGDLFTAPQQSEGALLRSLSPMEVAKLYEALGKGLGEIDVPAIYVIKGERKVGTITKCTTAVIPDEFLDKVPCQI